MRINILCIFIAICCLLSGCNGAVSSYFKRSANNNLDNRSVVETKRRPLYNQKYISIAKSNISNDDTEYDDLSDLIDEAPSAASKNQNMYMKMLKDDQCNKQSSSSRYPNLLKSKEKLASVTTANRNEDKIAEKMKQELSEIKLMLQETKREMLKQKCPNAKTSINEDHQDVKHKSKSIDQDQEQLDKIKKELKRLPPPDEV